MGELNVAEAFLGAAQYYGDRPALVTPRLRLSHRQLTEMARQTANLLNRQGLAPGDPVGIALSDPGEAVVTAMAVWMLGGTVAILDFRSRAEERAGIAQAFRLKVILQERKPPGAGSYSSYETGRDWTDRIHAEPAHFELRPAAHTALISPTSGTTGTPQGISFTHSSLLVRLLMLQAESGDHGDSLYLNPLAIHFAASRNHTFAKLLSGGTVHFAPIFATAEELSELMLSTDATYSLMVPLQIDALLTLTSGRGQMYPKLRTLYCGGALLAAETSMRAYYELSKGFRVIYGSGVAGTICELRGAEIIAHPETVGRAVPLVRLEIVDVAGKVLGHGQEGHVRLQSPGLADGVMGSMAQTSDRIADGWAYPGDLGSLSQDGFLTLLGRASEMIIRGGANVHPEEVEAVLRRHPQIAEVAVASVPDDRSGEEIAAFVVTRGEVTADELEAHMRPRISPDKRPRRYIFLDSLPRNAMGKILRRELANLS
jgi:long-chain acyl-CoA synthetase